MPKLAWYVSTGYAPMERGEADGTIIFASSELRARLLFAREHLMARARLMELEVERKERFDTYAPGPVPASVLLAANWWFECKLCGHPVYDEGCDSCADESEDGQMQPPVCEDTDVWCSAACRESTRAEQQLHVDAKRRAQVMLDARFPGSVLAHVNREHYNITAIFFHFPQQRSRQSCTWDGFEDMHRGKLHVLVSAMDLPLFREYGGMAPEERWESEGGACR